MNVFQIIADWSHVAAVILIIVKIVYTKSCAGISGRTQLLFAAVYTARYSDLWLDLVFVSVYNTIMKLAFIIASYTSIFLIFCLYRGSYKQKKDLFLTELLLVPSFILSITISYSSYYTEILWTFSICLEAVAILPQFYMIYKSKQIEKVILFYLIFLGCYRALYIGNWIYRFIDERHFDPISIAGGMVYAFVYIAGLILFICGGVKVVIDNKPTSYLRRNIFFISSNEPMGHEALIHNQVEVEKSENVGLGAERV